MPRHQVWEVYDQQRTVRLNRKYYAAKVGTARRRNFRIELVIALSTSSAVGGLWIVADFLGGFLWKAIGTVAAILAVYKPVARTTEKLRDLETRATAYRGVEFDFERLVRDILRRSEYDASLQEEFEALVEKLRSIAESYIDPDIDEALRRSLYHEVLTELPEAGYFVPTSDHDGSPTVEAEIPTPTGPAKESVENHD